MTVLEHLFGLTDFSPLLFDEQVFNVVEARLYQLEFLLDLYAKVLDVLFAGHGFIDELGQALYDCDFLLCHVFNAYFAMPTFLSTRSTRFLRDSIAASCAASLCASVVTVVRT